MVQHIIIHDFLVVNQLDHVKLLSCIDRGSIDAEVAVDVFVIERSFCNGLPCLVLSIEAVNVKFGDIFFDHTALNRDAETSDTTAVAKVHVDGSILQGVVA